MAGFGVMSLGCALAPSAGALIGARALEGVFGALLTPASLALIVAAFPPLARLVDLGAAAWSADGRARWTGAADLAGALAAARKESAREREVERSRLEMMRRYAEHTGCRRSFLLSYFGQDYRGPCGACDNDRRPAPTRPPVEPFPVGARVASDHWGEGTVQHCAHIAPRAASYPSRADPPGEHQEDRDRRPLPPARSLGVSPRQITVSRRP